MVYWGDGAMQPTQARPAMPTSLKQRIERAMEHHRRTMGALDINHPELQGNKWRWREQVIAYPLALDLLRDVTRDGTIAPHPFKACGDWPHCRICKAKGKEEIMADDLLHKKAAIDMAASLPEVGDDV